MDGQLSPAATTELVRAAPRQRSSELEAVRGRAPVFSIPSFTYSATSSCRYSRGCRSIRAASGACTKHDLQHRYLFQHQHRYSALLGRRRASPISARSSSACRCSFLSASIGLCALTAIIRAFRSDPHVGNFFVDMWRVVIYMFLPAAFVLSLVFLVAGHADDLSERLPGQHARTHRDGND